MIALGATSIAPRRFSSASKSEAATAGSPTAFPPLRQEARRRSRNVVPGQRLVLRPEPGRGNVSPRPAGRVAPAVFVHPAGVREDVVRDRQCLDLLGRVPAVV